jgi:hypothetical protein
MAKNSNKFVVDLGNVELDENSRRKVAAVIQSAVLQYFAAHTETPLNQVQLLNDVGIQGMIVGPDDDNGKPPAKAPGKARKR